MFGREIPLRKNNGIWFTALPGSKGDPALFRMESPGGRQGRHFPNAKATGFWEGISLKIGIAAVFSGHLATPNRTRELSCGFRWQPYGKLCCFCVAVTPGAKRCLATPRGVPKNQEKSLRSKGQRLWEKVRCFCENSEPGKWKFCLPSSHRETEDCSAYTTHNMHKIGNLVLYKEHAVDLLAQIKGRHQNQCQGE